MIIGGFVSLLGQRLAATAVALWVMGIASSSVVADVLPDSTWVALNPLPHQARSPVFALAVDPSNGQVVVAGTSDGSLLRSTDGAVHWMAVHAGGEMVTAIAFDPYGSGLVLAGTLGSGALVSRDGGVSWSAAAGLEGRSVRIFAFSLTIAAAGTDRGVFISPDGVTWSPSGLSGTSIDALAVEAIHTPVRLVAGSDQQTSGGALPIFQSTDGGASWTTLYPPLSGSIAVKLAAGPLPPTGNVRPLLVGTNTGLFLSTDNGATFLSLSGGSLLPTTDYTQINYSADHFDRFYVASDGGGSRSGGLWRSTDGGQSFASLNPPQPSVTSVAVSNADDPILYVATFQPSNHVATLWAFHDRGGIPIGPPSTESPTASGVRPSQPGTSVFGQILGAPQLPYVALGVAALVVVLTAVVAHLRGRHR